MCVPIIISLASLAMGAVSSVMQYQAQQQAADAQLKQQKRMSDLAAQAQQAQESQIRFKQQQDQELRAREMGKVSQEASALASRNIVAAGEAGITGASVDALLAEGTRQELGFYEGMTRQGSINDVGAARTITSTRLGTSMQLTDINRYVAKPHWASLAIGIGRSAVDSYGMYRTLSATPKAPSGGNAAGGDPYSTYPETR